MWPFSRIKELEGRILALEGHAHDQLVQKMSYIPQRGIMLPIYEQASVRAYPQHWKKEVQLCDAIQALADHVGVEFKYVAESPACVSVTPRKKSRGAT